VNKRLNDFLNKDNVLVESIKLKESEAFFMANYYPRLLEFITVLSIYVETDIEEQDLFVRCVISSSIQKIVVLTTLYYIDGKGERVSVNSSPPKTKSLIKVRDSIIEFLEAFNIEKVLKDQTIKELKIKQDLTIHDLAIMTSEDRELKNDLVNESIIMKHILHYNENLIVENPEDLDFLNNELVLEKVCKMEEKELVNLLSGHSSKEWSDIIELNMGF
jgi:hypothetical protein